MSEVIEDYIRRNANLSQAQAFEGFLKQDRIRTWVGDDAQRRDRLQREFSRIWDTLHTTPGAQQVQVHRQAPQPAPPSPREEPREPKAGPAGPPASGQVTRPASAAPAPAVPPRRRLHVLCAACSRYAIFAQGTHVACASCGTTFQDMLGLVPVKPVGPFAFVFGEGWKGVATAVGLGALLLAVYGVFRWV